MQMLLLLQILTCPCTLLKKGSNKHDRLLRSGVETVLAACVREYRATYFGNDSPFTTISLGPISVERLKWKTAESGSESAKDDNEDNDEDSSEEDWPDHSNLKRKPAHQKALVEHLLRW
ncbi:hypothetical protein BT96DRAFT_943438 [Gymnopus androsaceus JB14]|uniref:Uncharacterized protein n=1 Tax=Gymnopus androsaceus JB14 TaxID=1447944 RepID=A0A6A4H7G8_9AGAR|nr:hypothetical protein BT96DRAFT_943438 [Gymnopus androsaceus JB14]